MGVRIDKSRQDDAAADVQFLCSAGFREGFYFCARSYGRDQAVAHEERAVFDDAEIGKRGAASRAAAAERQEL